MAFSIAARWPVMTFSISVGQPAKHCQKRTLGANSPNNENSHTLHCLHPFRTTTYNEASIVALFPFFFFFFLFLTSSCPLLSSTTDRAGRSTFPPCSPSSSFPSSTTLGALSPRSSFNSFKLFIFLHFLTHSVQPLARPPHPEHSESGSRLKAAISGRMASRRSTLNASVCSVPLALLILSMMVSG